MTRPAPETALVVIASPHPHSFVHAMARAAVEAFEARGVACRIHDLYDESYPPVAGPGETATVGEQVEPGPAQGDRLVARHRRELMEADHLVVAHPNWWGKPPAIMSGWMDRTLVPGVVYRLAERDGLPTPLLSLGSVLVLNTGDTSPQRERDVFGDPLDAIWRRCVGAYLGQTEFKRLLAGPMSGSTESQRRAWLDSVAKMAGQQL